MHFYRLSDLSTVNLLLFVLIGFCFSLSLLTYCFWSCVVDHAGCQSVFECKIVSFD